MMEHPNNWDRLEALFHEALGIPIEARAAFLDRVCENEPLLGHQLEVLLRADQATLGFEAPSPRSEDSLFAIAAEVPLARPEARIGPFRLERLIGTGGMGAVWLAQRADEQFEQRVAIKLIKRGMDTDEVLSRFRRERQVLARFEHPNIARLLDGGATPDGRPYLVMEYIDGQAITDYCRAAGLSIHDRLALFLHVCMAVQYAHQNLVVHRDLKPTNLLVAANGTPKLLDFGIAKILRPEDRDASATTATELRLLTPRYASPEQVKNEPVTTATDIYSLGVILFELLTGAEPYQLTTRSRAEYERAICEQEPLRPSAILTHDGGAGTGRAGTTGGETFSITHAKRQRRRLVGDLDSIVLKALQKNARDRYGSVQQFADDIQRFLSGQPVLARPQTSSYRITKFITRNKVAVMAAAAVAFALVAGVVASATFAVREAQQRALAETRLREARTQTAIAEAINKFLNEDLLASVDPEWASDRNLTVRSVLDKAAQKIGSRFRDQPWIEASIQSTLGTTYESLGEYQAAEPHLARAFSLLAEISGKRSEAAILAMARLGSVKRCRAHFAEAEPLIKQAVEFARETLGPEHPTTLRAAHELGELYVDLGRAAEAIEVLEPTLRFCRTVLGTDAAATLKTMDTLAVAYSLDGRNEDAERLNLEIVERRTRVFGEDTFGTISALNNLAFVRMNLGKYEEAEILFRTAVERSRPVLGDDHPSTLTSLDNLGLIATHRGHFADAEKLHLEAYQGRLRKQGPDHPDTLTSLANLGFVYTNSGRHAEAEPLFLVLVSRLQEVSGPEHPYTLTMENNLAYCLMELGRLEDAEQRFTGVVERRERVLGRDHPDTIGSMSNLAKVRIDQGRFGEARVLLDDAMIRASGSLPSGHGIVGSLFFRQGLCQIGLQQIDDAEASLRKALEIFTAALGPEHPRVAAVRTSLDQLRVRPTEVDATSTSVQIPSP